MTRNASAVSLTYSGSVWAWGRAVVSSIDQNENMKRRYREALAVGEFSDGDIDTISRAELPAEAAQYNHELTEGQSAADRREVRSE